MKGIQKVIYAGFAALALIAASMPVLSDAAAPSPAAAEIRR